MPRILLRRSTAADWSTTNPILSDGEPAFEHDTGRMKVGDGVTAWSALAYTGGSGGGGPIASTDITDATTVGKAVLTAADAPTARAAIGAGTSSLALGTTSTTALAGNTAPTDIGAATAAQGAKADTAVQPAALTSLAPLASPALTGTPTAPTATAGTNSTQLANTAFVAAAIAALINSAPGALDTLKELADAIGDDANYAATVTNALALKAPLASPTFTGTVAGITKAMVGLGSVDNTADATKAVLSATKLTTARTINGVSFDGTANVTVADSTKVPTSSVGAASGVASLDSGTHLPVAQIPAGSMIVQAFTSANYASLARPTARTDVTVFWVGDSTTSSSTQPANRIAGDLVATKQA